MVASLSVSRGNASIRWYVWAYLNQDAIACWSCILQELAAEPRIRQVVREVFRTRSELHTKPTQTGLFHPLLEPYAKYGPIKRLRHKRLDDIQGSDMYLRVHQAVREKLITVSIEMPKTRDGKPEVTVGRNHDNIALFYQSGMLWLMNLSALVMQLTTVSSSC